ncbi:hypothetical protein L596_015608 [Steinernema carpocapsae]|uniref:Uncharacterized protein n=1 Tax=Steinernema carpocapsae TaxID=34508 RepID=A0A4U5NGH4_STECR|nr:hypothetical protein L596_015608 [Steinernema carpocapsae]
MISMRQRICFLLLLSVTQVALGSYCGQAAIPFSFQALTNGQPVLGCARPSCFGCAADSAQFFKIFKRPDGFLRKTDIKSHVPVEDIAEFVPQFAKCEQAYNSSECNPLNQWIGGIAPAANVTEEPIKLQCCTYTKLQDFSTDRGEAEVRPGQIVIGGEVTHDGRQFGFDYISNIRREIDEAGKVVYSVIMKRFPCLPEPKKNMKLEKVDAQVREFLIDNIEGKPLKPKKTFEEQKFDLPEQMPSEKTRQYSHSQLSVSPGDVDPEQVQVNFGGMKPVQKGVQTQVSPASMPIISDSAVLNNAEVSHPASTSNIPTARVYEEDVNLSVQKLNVNKNSDSNSFNNNGFNNNNYNNQNQYNQNYNGFNNRNGQNGQNGFNQNSNNGFNNGFTNDNQNYNNGLGGFNNGYNNNYNGYNGLNNGFNNNGFNNGYNNNGYNNNGFNMFTPMPLLPMNQPIFPPATFNNGNVNSGFSPLPQLRIPSPEDVERALPAAGRSLINNMARTFLGFSTLRQ